ncbi:MAG TPA: cytochrome c [Longimicrobium sp.]
MVIGKTGAALVTAMLIAACRGGSGDADAPGDGGAAAQPAAPRGEAESPGRTLYVRACIMCHGERGAGTQLAPALNDRPREVGDVVRVVTEGVATAEPPHTPMPPRGDGGFTDQEIRTVAEYVHGLAR